MSEHAHPLVALAQRAGRADPALWPVALVVEWAAIWTSAREHGDKKGEKSAVQQLESLLRDHR